MKRELHPYVYIMTNKNNKVLYTGVTSNLLRRVTEHKDKMVVGFTSRYNVTKFVYYEDFATMEEAIARVKQIKGGSQPTSVTILSKDRLNGFEAKTNPLDESQQTQNKKTLRG